jgi:protein translocase SecG subunit
MSVLHWLLCIVWFVSGIGSAACVLAHSGDGMGVSDMIGLSISSESASAGVVERNLDRLTLICVGTFVACLVICMFVWPQAPVMQAITTAAGE